MTRSLCFFLLLLTASAHAAISVSGIAHQTNYTGSRDLTVGDPAGFFTTATLNGAAIAVGGQVTASASGFYQLDVVQTADAGGGSDSQTFLFNIREPGRGSTETGLPAFTAAPLVNDAPSAVATGQLVAIAPVAYPDDLPIPVICLLQKTNGDPLWLNTRVLLGNLPANTIQLRRGFGYTLVPPNTLSANASTAGLNSSRNIAIEDDTTIYTNISGNITTSIDYGDDARIMITGDLTIDPGITFTIGKRGMVRIANDADIHVDGTFEIEGTPANPTTFAPTTPGGTWGGFFLQQAASELIATGGIFHGSGADADWFDTNAGFASHRDEQALFLVGPAGARLDLSNCYLIENAGQLLHNDEGGDIFITRSLLQGAPTCGELTGGTLTVDRSAMLLFPTADPTFADGDNDAIYLTSGQHQFTNTVIGYTQDDGIDTGGSPNGYTTNTTAQSCWFESILHEAMSNSGEKHVTATDTIFFNCGQTLECGYDGPQSTMLRCLAVANMVGARFGDNYDWDYSNNQLTVTDSLLLNNLFHDIWGYDFNSWTYNSAKMEVTGTLMTKPDDLARHPGNNQFTPATDASLIAPYMPVPGSDVGIAITGTPRQSAIADYPQQFTVQLSTFSSNTVTAGYSVIARDTLDSEDQTLLSGTLTFTPGETSKLLDLPLPAGSYALVRVALNSPTSAVDTGGEVWFNNPTTPPTADLITRGSVWNYDASRAEPAAGWTGQPYDDSGWSSGPATIGFGNGGEPTELTSGEQGPSDDRTTTVYFRHEFQVTDATSISGLTLNLKRDDGAVVYLNGVEVARSNMDPGVVTYATRASGSAGNATEEATYYEIPLATAALLTGINVLAVEVHQSSLTSSDLGFDLDLISTNAIDQVVNLLRSGEGAFIYWSDSAATFQESDDLSIWTSADVTSPFRILTEDAKKFYRILYP